MGKKTFPHIADRCMVPCYFYVVWYFYVSKTLICRFSQCVGKSSGLALASHVPGMEVSILGLLASDDPCTPGSFPKVVSTCSPSGK
jgi:hypothetical protein